jgi:SnoaL-like polyketide cyclase
MQAGSRWDPRGSTVTSRYVAARTIIVECYLLGTYLGPLRTLPPTGRSFRARMTSFFLFEGERIVCERVYFDQATILRQLGVAHAPSSIAGRVTTLISHPLTIGRALWKARNSRARSSRRVAAEPMSLHGGAVGYRGAAGMAGGATRGKLRRAC